MKAEEMALLRSLADEWNEVAEKQCAAGKRSRDEGAAGFGLALALAAGHLRMHLEGMEVEG